MAAPSSPVARNADKVAALAALPREARAAVAGLGNEQLDTPYRQGGWTVRQVIHHVADAHLNAYLRMKLVVAEEHPTLKAWQENDWASHEDGRRGDVEDSLRLLDGVHARMARFLGSLPEPAFARTGNHTERGVITLQDLLDTYFDHGRHHLAQISGLRRTRGW